MLQCVNMSWHVPAIEVIWCWFIRCPARRLQEAPYAADALKNKWWYKSKAPVTIIYLDSCWLTQDSSRTIDRKGARICGNCEAWWQCHSGAVAWPHEWTGSWGLSCTSSIWHLGSEKLKKPDKHSEIDELTDQLRWKALCCNDLTRRKGVCSCQEDFNSVSVFQIPTLPDVCFVCRQKIWIHRLWFVFTANRVKGGRHFLGELWDISSTWALPRSGTEKKRARCTKQLWIHMKQRDEPILSGWDFPAVNSL